MAEYYGREIDISFPPESHDTTEVYTLSNSFFKYGQAYGMWTFAQGFILLKDSLISKKNTCDNESIRIILSNLVKDGCIHNSEIDDYYKLTTDIRVSAPSSAASLVLGYDSDAIGWETQSGKKLPKSTNKKH
jgi:hypothetical protein